jgi:DnaJ-domain-containing protein 1
MEEYHHKKLSLLQDLIQLSFADEKVHFMEEHFINTIAKGLGITEKELDQLKENAVSFNPHNNEMERITHFYRLVLLVGVDGHIDKKEIQFCESVGLRMGLNPLAMQELISRISNTETHQLPPEEVIKIFQIYHN